MSGVRINSKIFPSDYNKPFGSLGIKFPMNAPKRGNVANLFNVSYTTEEQAISNYINLLMTKRGERYMQPNFGVGLWWYVFENNTPGVRFLLEEDIKLQADRWLPYIINYKISVTQSEDINGQGHAMNIQIVFSVTEQGANRTITAFTGAEQNLIIEVE